MFSDIRKLDFLRRAKEEGYRIYLYFVATQDPIINIGRVQARVDIGGHAVSPDKVLSRYARSISNLREIEKQTDRTYIFDNSSTLLWVAEVTNVDEVLFQTDNVPQWIIEALKLDI